MLTAQIEKERGSREKLVTALLNCSGTAPS
jgi:hypothetical protein